MRRLRRILLNAASAVSLVLGLAIVALWVRSYWRCDEVGIEHNAPHIWRITFISAPRGCVTVDYRSASFPPRPGARERWYFDRTTSGPVARWDAVFKRGVIRWEFAQFVYASPSPPRGGSFRIITLPLWFVTALLLTTPAALTFRGMRRKRPAVADLCPQCGYDCRATPNRCPECGRAAPVQPSA